MAIGSGLQDMQGFQLIMNFLVMPIYFLSGALFPSDGPAQSARLHLTSLTRFRMASTACARAAATCIRDVSIRPWIFHAFSSASWA